MPVRQPKKYRRHQGHAERRHENGLHHRRNGRWYRYGCSAHHCTDRQRNGHPDYRYRHHPFRWEGDKKIDQALDGVEEISKHVDALLVINNEKLSEIYSELSVDDAFDKADDTLSVAAKSIAEIITLHGKVNLDFNDVKTVLKDGGVAIMSTGYGEGDNRVSMAIQNAQHSPLLNNNDIFNSKKVLLNISYSSQHKLMMSEMDEVKEFMNRFSRDFETKFGMAIDDKLEQSVKIPCLPPASASRTFT